MQEKLRGYGTNERSSSKVTLISKEKKVLMNMNCNSRILYMAKKERKIINVINLSLNLEIVRKQVKSRAHHL